MTPSLTQLLRLSPILAMACLSSCATQGGLPGATRYLNGQAPVNATGPNGLPPDTVSFWDGGAGNGPPRIHLKLDEQVADFYRGDVLIGRSRVSSGDEIHPSPTGKLSVLEKDRNHKSSRYGDFVDGSGTVVQSNVDIKKDRPPAGSRFAGSPMTNFMRLTYDGVGMHTGFLPGYPASHGCIRMPDHMSAVFYDNVQVGTPVTVTR
jgi:lipoprotein-anchoring transpeptidase ErfK/SrfK